MKGTGESSSSSESETDSLDHTTAEETCSICHGAGFLHPVGASGLPDFGRVVECECAQKLMESSKPDRLKEYSQLGPLTGHTFDDLLPSGRRGSPLNRARFQNALEDAKSFAENPEGWLVLVGPSGCGKTHLAAAIANRRIALGQPALFVLVPDLLDHLRAAYNPQSEVPYDILFDQVRNAPLLILDDLGSQSSTPWVQEKLFQILNHRFNQRLATVFTANGPLERMPERFHSRLIDGSISQVCIVEENETLGAISDNFELLDKMVFENFLLDGMGADPNQRRTLERAYESAVEYAEAPEGWLVLVGPYGCGKTHLAAAIANYRYSQGKPALFIVVPDLLDHLRATYAPDSRTTFDATFESLRQCPLLILDDLGAQTSSPWAKEKLFQLINHRYNGRLPTVFTTSLSFNEIAHETDHSIVSRLQDIHLSQVLIIDTPDYRQGRRGAPQPRQTRGRIPGRRQ